MAGAGESVVAGRCQFSLPVPCRVRWYANVCCALLLAPRLAPTNGPVLPYLLNPPQTRRNSRNSPMPPVQSATTVPAFVGDDSLLTSVRRVITARRTVCHIHVESLQLPGTDRRDLAARCEAAVRGQANRIALVAPTDCGEGHALVA